MSSTPRRRLVVLASGDGSNLQAIVDACASGALPAQVVAVVADRGGCGALDRAERVGIPAVRVAGEHLAGLPPGAPQRREYDTRLADVVGGFAPDWVVCAGWMRILSMNFLRHFPGIVVNLHPALPGELPGRDSIRRAFDEHRFSGRKRTGVMVHLVPDEGVDNGPVLATAEVLIEVADTLETLAARIHATEHRLLVDTLRTLCGVPGVSTATSRARQAGTITITTGAPR